MSRRSPPVTELLDLPCACASARRAARALTQLYDGYLREHRIEAAQFALLGAMDSLGAARQADLGRAMGIDKTTLSRNLRVLEREGWIAFALDENTGERLVTLSRAGSRRLAAARPAWQQAQAAVRDALTDARWSAAHAAFRSVTEAAQRLARRPPATAARRRTR